MTGFKNYEWTKLTEAEQMSNSQSDLNQMKRRRSIREFSTEPISKEVILNAIQTASTAPSGAHKQPWFFCLVSSADLKRKIRLAAEEEEKKNYNERMSE